MIYAMMSLFFGFKKIAELVESLEITKTNILKISATFYGSLGFIFSITAGVKTMFRCYVKVGMRAWQKRANGQCENSQVTSQATVL